MNSVNTFVLRTLAIIGVSLASLSAYAQSYPSRPITFVVPYGPGGSTDPVARQYAMQLQKALGVEVNIENKPGGSGTIGTGMVVRADAPWKTFAEFLQHVKDNPGKVRASVSGLRTVPDLLAQEFNKVAGTKLRTVPFTGGSGEALVALLGNRVEATLFTGAVGIPSHVQAGKVRVLAVFKKGVYDPVPEAQPTVDAGYNTTLAGSFYVIAPKGLAPDVLDKLTKVSMEIVQSAEFIKFSKEGYALDPKGPTALRAEIVRDTATFIELLKVLDQK